MSSDQILNFHDAVLLKSDLKILKSNAWLNDNCIHFALTKLSIDLDSPQCRFIDPSVLSFFMHQWDEEDDWEQDLWGVKQSKDQQPLAVLLPINDNYISQNWSTPFGGVHWSLVFMLVSYSGSDCPSSARFWHFDSSGGTNQRAAVAVAQKIHRVFGRWQKAKSMAPMMSDTIQFQECSAPQQQNGYDCGIHTLATAESLANAVASGEFTLQTKELEATVKNSVATAPSFCSKMRQRIAKEAEELAAGAL